MYLETVKDIKRFYKTIGALDELSERNLLEENDNGKEHLEYLKCLLNRYDIDYEDKYISNLIEETDYIIELESLIDEKFTDLMCEV